MGSLILLILGLPFHRLSRIVTRIIVMEDLNLSLLSLLECPVCKEYMVPPISLCENGHNVCITCRVFIKDCPTCLKPFRNMFNTSLGNLAKKLLFPCKKSAYGCTERVRIQHALSHKYICPFRRHTSCPFGVTPGQTCNWKGHSSLLKIHLRVDHNTIITKVRNNFKPIVPCRNQSFFYKVVSIMNKLFLYVWEVRRQRLHLSVFYIGPENIAYKFKYRFTFCKITTCLHYSRVARILELSQWNERFALGNSVSIHIDKFRVITSRYPSPFALNIFRHM